MNVSSITIHDLIDPSCATTPPQTTQSLTHPTMTTSSRVNVSPRATSACDQDPHLSTLLQSSIKSTPNWKLRSSEWSVFQGQASELTVPLPKESDQPAIHCHALCSQRLCEHGSSTSCGTGTTTDSATSALSNSPRLLQSSDGSNFHGSNRIVSAVHPSVSSGHISDHKIRPTPTYVVTRYPREYNHYPTGLGLIGDSEIDNIEPPSYLLSSQNPNSSSPSLMLGHHGFHNVRHPCDGTTDGKELQSSIEGLGAAPLNCPMSTSSSGLSPTRDSDSDYYPVHGESSDEHSDEPSYQPVYQEIRGVHAESNQDISIVEEEGLSSTRQETSVHSVHHDWKVKFSTNPIRTTNRSLSHANKGVNSRAMHKSDHGASFPSWQSSLNHLVIIVLLLTTSASLYSSTLCSIANKVDHLFVNFKLCRFVALGSDVTTELWGTPVGDEAAVCGLEERFWSLLLKPYQSEFPMNVDQIKVDYEEGLRKVTQHLIARNISANKGSFHAKIHQIMSDLNGTLCQRAAGTSGDEAVMPSRVILDVFTRACSDSCLYCQSARLEKMTKCLDIKNEILCLDPKNPPAIPVRNLSSDDVDILNPSSIPLPSPAGISRSAHIESFDASSTTMKNSTSATLPWTRLQRRESLKKLRSEFKVDSHPNRDIIQTATYPDIPLSIELIDSSRSEGMGSTRSSTFDKWLNRGKELFHQCPQLFYDGDRVRSLWITLGLPPGVYLSVMIMALDQVSFHPILLDHTEAVEGVNEEQKKDDINPFDRGHLLLRLLSYRGLPHMPSGRRHSPETLSIEDHQTFQDIRIFPPTSTNILSSALGESSSLLWTQFNDSSVSTICKRWTEAIDYIHSSISTEPLLRDELAKALIAHGHSEWLFGQPETRTRQLEASSSHIHEEKEGKIEEKLMKERDNRNDGVAAISLGTERAIRMASEPRVDRHPHSTPPLTRSSNLSPWVSQLHIPGNLDFTWAPDIDLPLGGQWESTLDGFDTVILAFPHIENIPKMDDVTSPLNALQSESKTG